MASGYALPPKAPHQQCDHGHSPSHSLPGHAPAWNNVNGSHSHSDGRHQLHGHGHSHSSAGQNGHTREHSHNHSHGPQHTHTHSHNHSHSHGLQHAHDRSRSTDTSYTIRPVISGNSGGRLRGDYDAGRLSIGKNSNTAPMFGFSPIEETPPPLSSYVLRMLDVICSTRTNNSQ